MRFLALTILMPTLASPQTISTIAGGGATDSGIATTTNITPFSTVVDTGGNFYVADNRNHRVFKVSAVGAMVLIAGSGEPGFSGDDGPATIARLNYPSGLALDVNGVLYIADSENHRIRKVAINGTITTVAGNGSATFGGDGGAATAASLIRPIGVSLDANGNLLIADSGNNRIRKVVPTGVISTVAGGGIDGVIVAGGLATNALLGQPVGVAADANGNFFIVEFLNHRIRRVTNLGLITAVAGTGTNGFSGDGGLATDATISNPYAVAVDANAIIYVADSGNNRIRRITTNGTISTVAGDGSPQFSGDGGVAIGASLYLPTSVTTDTNGSVFIADFYNQRVRKITSDGLIDTVAGNGNGDGGLATRTNLGADGIASDAQGNLYVADYYGQRVRKVMRNGQIGTVAGNGAQGFSGDGGLAINAKLSYPTAVAVDATGNLYVVDTSNNRIRKVTPNGVIITVAGDGTGTCGTCGNAPFPPPPNGDGGPAINAKLYLPDDITVDTNGNLFLVEGYNSRIRKVTSNGVISTYVGGGSNVVDGVPATSIELYHPAGVAADAYGNLFVGQSSNSVIRKVASDGIISTVAGNGVYGFSGDGGSATGASINYPRVLAVDKIGNLYFASTYSERIRKVTPSGIISTVAGNGINGFSGDGGQATDAKLNSPRGLATDPDGNVLISDGGNRVRKVTFPFSLAAVISRKTHGGTDIFDLPLDINQMVSGSVSVESRAIGSGHTVVFRFNGAVLSVGAASAVAPSSAGVGNITFALSGNEVILDLTNIPDNQRLTISLTGVNGTINTATSMGFLVGDVNNSRTVNSSDISGIKARSGQVADAMNFKYDLNASGAINSSDISAVKGRSGLVMQ